MVTLLQVWPSLRSPAVFPRKLVNIKEFPRISWSHRNFTLFSLIQFRGFYIDPSVSFFFIYFLVWQVSHPASSLFISLASTCLYPDHHQPPPAAVVSAVVPATQKHQGFAVTTTPPSRYQSLRSLRVAVAPRLFLTNLLRHRCWQRQAWRSRPICTSCRAGNQHTQMMRLRRKAVANARSQTSLCHRRRQL